MRVYQEHPGLLLDRFKGRIKQPLPPLVELGNEGHVRVSARTLRAAQIESVRRAHLCAEDNISDHDRGRSANALHTVHQDFATFVLRSLDELYCVVEDACDVFVNVVFQMIALVLDAFIFEVVLTVVCRAVDDVRDASLLDLSLISCHQVTRKVQEVVEDL